MHDHKKTGENFLNNIIETIADSVPKQKSGGFFNDGASVSDKLNIKINKRFERHNSVYNIFGGGKSADVFLWRNKKTSSSILVGATLVWVFFEWLDYHFITLACFALVVGMIFQFVWSNASGLVNRSPSEVPRLVLPNDFLVNPALFVGEQVNMFLGFIQDLACGRDLKMLAMVVVGLWAAAVIGSWCNFLTVLYIGFVAAHTVPVLYEKYEDQVDDFISNLFGQLQQQYRKLDEGVLSKIPKGNLKVKKNN